MKKIKIILLLMVLSVIGISLIYKNKDSKMSAKNNLAIMVKNESGEYVSSNSIPTGDYVLNEDKTFCENGGKVKSYDSSTGQIGFSFLGSDRCSLYFDIVLDEENPTITNLSVSGTTVTATLSDNVTLASYGISTSNTVEPTSWTSISGSSYNLNTSITTTGIYYLWVKDSKDNKIVSNKIVIDNEKPVISNLTINDTKVTATLSDSIALSSYGISTSNTVEPTSWTSISGSSYNLSTSITTKGIYYLWVKDSKDNIIVSEAIDLETKGWEVILANNTINTTTPDFSSGAETNEGMYAATDDLGTSYYFRGAVNNNWVKFGKDSSGSDMYWRIIRINGDHSIRMIYTGTTSPTSSTATVMTGTGTQLNSTTYAFNSSSYNKAESAGYMYTEGSQQGNSTSSTIKNEIDYWYASTTLNTDATTKSLVADQIFCNDRSVPDGGWHSSSYQGSTAIMYGSYSRVNTSSPILTCPTAIDKFTVNTSNGNEALTYPVGLITADEVVMAGSKAYLGGLMSRFQNSSYYLYTGQDYWTGSPYDALGSSTGSSEYIVSSLGILTNASVEGSYGARPVISLSAKAKLSGSGTYNDVYTVS